jgi:hypothetical protein
VVHHIQTVKEVIFRNYYSGGNYISVFSVKSNEKKSPIGTKNKKSHFFVFQFYDTFSQNNFDRKNRNLISVFLNTHFLIFIIKYEGKVNYKIKKWKNNTIDV